MQIDLRTTDTPLADLYGRKAVFATSEGERLVGTLAENPHEHLPRIVFDDGRWGRADFVLELV